MSPGADCALYFQWKGVDWFNSYNVPWFILIYTLHNPSGISGLLVMCQYPVWLKGCSEQFSDFFTVMHRDDSSSTCTEQSFLLMTNVNFAEFYLAAGSAEALKCVLGAEDWAESTKFTASKAYWHVVLSTKEPRGEKLVLLSSKPSSHLSNYLV